MPRKPRPNITPEDVGKFYYWDGKVVYRLVSCQSEPQAAIQRVEGDHPVEIKFLSELAYLERLVPQHPLPPPESKPLRKERKDRGTKRPGKAPSIRVSEPGQQIEEIDLEKVILHAGGIPGVVPDPPTVTYKSNFCVRDTLKEAVFALFGMLGKGSSDAVIAYIQGRPDTPMKQVLLNALGVEDNEVKTE